MTKYVDLVAALETRQNAIGKAQTETDRLKTLLRGISSRFEGTRNFIRELGRHSNREIQTLTAKGDEINDSGKKKPVHPKERDLFTHQPRGMCYECGEDGHYKRECRKLSSTFGRRLGVVVMATEGYDLVA